MNPLSHLKTEPYPLFIDGEFLPSKSGEITEALNPVNNEVFARYYKGGKADVEAAIAAARKAFDEGPWGKSSNLQRSKLLLKARDILRRRSEEFACIETLDCGKLYPSVMYYEIDQALDAFEFAAGKCRNLEGKVIPVDGNGDHFNYVVYQPYGVVGEILTWNGPLMMGCQKIASILAAGNTVIVKPPTWASLSMLLLAEVFNEAGFPPGVINVVTGSGGEVGNALVTSTDVDMISMTGGTETGQKIITSSADSIKEIALELGGKSPNVIFDDVDIDETVSWALFGFNLNSGQVCVAGTRLILHENIYDEFLDKMKTHLESNTKPGDGFKFEQGINHQTLISPQHKRTVMGYIQKGKDEGARLITGGYEYQDAELAKGNFVPPTIFADVTPEMTIFQEEIFGPVLCVTKFSTEEEALKLANGTRYGLAAGVFTKDGKRAHRMATKLEAGQIYINTYYSKGINESPGTGWKASGLGVAGIHKYMHSKTIFSNNDKENPLPF